MYIHSSIADSPAGTAITVCLLKPSDAHRNTRNTMSVFTVQRENVAAFWRTF